MVGDLELRFAERSGAIARRLSAPVTVKRRRATSSISAPAFFVGRDETLARIAELLASGDRAAIAISGPDGIGKTVLVRRLLTDEIVSAFEGAVLLSRPAGVDDALQAIFQAAYEPERPFVPAGSRREELLGDLHMLIVVDEFTGSNDMVAELMSTAPFCSFIFIAQRTDFDPAVVPIELKALDAASSSALFSHASGDAATLAGDALPSGTDAAATAAQTPEGVSAGEIPAGAAAGETLATAGAGRTPIAASNGKTPAAPPPGETLAALTPLQIVHLAAATRIRKLEPVPVRSNGKVLGPLAGPVLHEEAVSKEPEAPAEAQKLDPAKALDAILASLTATENHVLMAFVITEGGPLDAGMASELAALPNIMPILESLERRGVLDNDGERYSLRGSVLSQLKLKTSLPRIDSALGWVSQLSRGDGASEAVAARADAINKLLVNPFVKDRMVEVVRTGTQFATALAFASRPDLSAEAFEIVLKTARKLPDRDAESLALHQMGTLAFGLDEEVRARELLSEALVLREKLNDDVGGAATRNNLSLLLGVRASAAPAERPAEQRGPVLWAIIGAVIALIVGVFGVNYYLHAGQVTSELPAPVHHAAHHARAHPEAAGAAVATVPNAGAPPANVVLPSPEAAPKSPSQNHAKKPHSGPHRRAGSTALPSIEAFSGSPSTVAAGEYSQLCFTIRNANAAFIEGVGPVASSGSHCVTTRPDRTTVMTLVARSGGREVKAFTTVAVTATTVIPEASP